MKSAEQIKAYNDSKSNLYEASEQFNIKKDGDMFLIAAQESLEQGQADVLLGVLQAPENRTLLAFVGWDLAKIVFHFLPDDCGNSLNFESHKNLLNLICDLCNPREICLSLSELLSDELPSQKLLVLLRLLRLTCYKLEGKFGRILIGILVSLQRCLKSRNDTVEQAEILETTVEFVDVVVQKTQNTLAEKSDDVTLLKEGLLSFLIALLEHPFVLVDFKIKSEMQEPSEQVDRNCKFAETVIGFLGVLENGCLKRLVEYGVNCGNIIQKPLNVDEDDNNGLSIVGLACLAFLTQVAGIGEQFIPVVTTGKYSLDINMVYINTLICTNGVKVIAKGLSLLLAVLDMIEANTLDHSYIDNKESTQLLINLRNLMIHSDDSGVRQESVKGFRKILSIFQPRGKYRLLRTLHQGDIQSGFAELLNLILKEEIVNSLQYDNEDSWFLGSKLSSFLLDDIFKVPPKALQSEFGIIEESNRVLSALNLVRFLLIRDSENKTMIHKIFPQLEDTYLKELRRVVQLSKATITLLVKEKQDEIRRGSTDPKKAAKRTLNVTTVDGSQLEQKSHKEQLEAFQSACLTLDMIESILARIVEVQINCKETSN